MRWSQLKSLLESHFDPELKLEIFCTVHRGFRGPNIGRYWITLKGELIWEVPRRVAPDIVEGRENPVAEEVTAVLRCYLDTPSAALFDLKLPGDHWGLVEILKCADSRVGKRRLQQLLPQSEGAAQIVAQRLQKR